MKQIGNFWSSTSRLPSAEPALLLSSVLDTISPENRSPEWAGVVEGLDISDLLTAFNKLFF